MVFDKLRECISDKASSNFPASLDITARFVVSKTCSDSGTAKSWNNRKRNTPVASQSIEHCSRNPNFNLTKIKYRNSSTIVSSNKATHGGFGGSKLEYSDKECGKGRH